MDSTQYTCYDRINCCAGYSKMYMFRGKVQCMKDNLLVEGGGYKKCTDEDTWGVLTFEKSL